MAGHWLLARVGKKVLRPGGKELSEWMVSATEIAGKRVVEFAPGLGLTATLLLESGPASYTGMDSDAEAVAVTRDAIGARGELVAEAARVLESGGRYLVHELCLVPDSLDDEIKTSIRKDLARSIRVNARPLTVAEWGELFAEAGFEVESTELRPMALLQPRRMIADEGPAGMARIVRNLLRDADARKRVLAMRKTFRTHERYLSAVGFVLRKR